MIDGQRERVGESAGGRGRTRRGFIGGVAAAGASYAVGGPLAGAGAQGTEPVCEPPDPGVRTSSIAVTPDLRIAWTADAAGTTITAHRTRDLVRLRSVDVGGAPLDIAISPRGDLALVTTAYYDRACLAVVDLLTGEVDRLDVGPEPGAVAFGPDGRSAYVAGGGRDGTLTRVDPRAGRTHEPVDVGQHPRGIAVDPAGEYALVAVNGDAHIAVVALESARVVRRIATAPFPYLVAVSPDGSRALASHNGFAASAATPIDLVRRRATRPVAVGVDPAGVAFTRSGTLALVAATGSRTVTVLDTRTWQRRRTVRHGGEPRSLAVAGRRAIVADGGTGELRAIGLGARR